MIARSTLRQIAEAVEAQSGDLEDVRDLVCCWERLHRDLHRANDLYRGGDEQAAEVEWRKLDAEFGKPLEQIVRDRRQERSS